jgi:hypothetical protein
MRFILYSQVKHKYNGAMTQINKKCENGFAKIWMVTTIGLIVLSVGLAVFGAWAFMNYSDQKDNVDTKIATAVAKAEKDQADADDLKFIQRDKEPMRQFTGPDDYGRVTFDYPKTWSVYIDKDALSGGDYEAYLNPIVVPPISSIQQFAIRVLIEEKDYDKVIATYDSLIKKGDLRSSSVTADGTNGIRLDGSFSKDIRGSAVIFKIRDKTLTIRTDANTFTADFDALIATIMFNQ